jgi:hypothetical protein
MVREYIVCMAVLATLDLGCGGSVLDDPSDAGPLCTTALSSTCPDGVAAYCKAGGYPSPLWTLVATDETSETTWCEFHGEQ